MTILVAVGHELPLANDRYQAGHPLRGKPGRFSFDRLVPLMQINLSSQATRNSLMKAGAVLLCAGVVLYAFLRNPGVADAQAHFASMRSDMTALLHHGGRISYQSENVKYGSALVDRELWDEGWSQALVKAFEIELASQGWKKQEVVGIEYCKNGMLTRILPHSGVKDAQGINSLIMEYNAETIRRCRS